MPKKPLGVLVVFTCFLLCLPLSATAARTTYVTIGTGGITGVYYPTGGAISSLVNKKREEYGIRATVESTGGSVFNINAIMAGDLEFGVVQSDRQYQAYKGLAEWQGRPQEKLRSVFSIHQESVNLLATVDSGIKKLSDLKGHRVNIGNPGSGQRGNAIDILAAAGIDFEKELRAVGLKPAESAKMLQSGQLDAFFYTVGHPNDSFIEATSGHRKVRFVNIGKSIIDKLVKSYPYYITSTTPISYYPGAVNSADVPSVSVKATLCTSIDVDAAIVYAVVKEVFDNLEAFKAMHPAYTELTREGMLQGLTAPLHPGAAKYFKEVGLIP